MGLYGDKSDYQELVKKNISRAKILYGLSEEDSKDVIKLLNEKDKIIEENGFWANFKLKKIDKKIEKIKINSKKTIKIHK